MKKASMKDERILADGITVSNDTKAQDLTTMT